MNSYRLKIHVLAIIMLTSYYSNSQNLDSLDAFNSNAIQLLRVNKNLEVIIYLSPKENLFIAASEHQPKKLVLFYHILSQALYYQNNVDDCILYSLKGVNFIQSTNNEQEHAFSYRYILDYLTSSYTRKNEFYKALLFNSLSQELNDKHQHNPLATVTNLNTSGIIFQNLNESQKALFNYKKALVTLQNIKEEDQTRKSYILQNISQSFFKLSQIDSSLIYLERSIALQEADPERFTADYFSSYATAANRYLVANKIDRAEAYFNLAAQHFHEAAPVTDIAHFYQVRGKFYQLNGEFVTAQTDFDLARNKLVIKTQSGQIRTSYPREYLALLATELDLAEAINKKGNSSNQAELYYQASHSSLREAQQIIQRLPSDALKHVIVQHAKDIYRHALNAAWMLAKEDVVVPRAELINIFESYQAQIINAEATRSKLIGTDEISEQNRKKHQKLEQQYDSVLHQSYQLEFDDDINSPYAHTTRRLYQLEDSIRQSQLGLRRDFPFYDRMMEQLDVLSSDDLSGIFEQSSNILQFFQFDDELFISHLSATDHELIKIPFPEEFQQTILRWVDNIHSVNFLTNSNISLEEQIKSSQVDGLFIYNKLIKPFEARLGETILIIPDGMIANIPFAAINSLVPTRPTDYVQAKYLIENYLFSYHFSLKLAAQMIQQKNNATLSARSFTPNQSAITISNLASNDTIRLTALPFSIKEGELATKLFGATFINPNQPSPGIIHEMKNVNLLHIGSHVVLNDAFPDQSYIPLRMDSTDLASIKPYELFREPLGSNIIIVNSCHSGAGKSIIGRGLVSFVSGFVLADAKSILSSRWAVRDKTGFDFMSDIFHQLKDQQTISKSLRNAQLNRLHANDPVLSHPAFWASYYLIGDMASSMPQTIPWSIYAGALLIGLLALIFIRRNRPNKST